MTRGSSLFVFGVAACLVAGCSGGNDSLMPMKKGAKWEYQMRMGLASTVDRWTVTGPARVGGDMGWEISGPGGTSRLGWSGSQLKAQMLAGTTYMPPVTLLDSGLKEGDTAKWSGMVTVASRRYDGKAMLRQSTEKFKVAGRNLTVTRCELQLAINGKSTTVTTWFAPSIGIVRQEERSGDELLRSIEYLQGP